LAREPRIEADPSEVERLDKVTVIQEWAVDVCFWHKADITTRSSNVRFWG